jgi:hypothetical protein
MHNKRSAMYDTRGILRRPRRCVLVKKTPGTAHTEHASMSSVSLICLVMTFSSPQGITHHVPGLRRRRKFSLITNVLEHMFYDQRS